MVVRRRVVLALGAGALTAPLTAFAQQLRVWRTGWLATSSQSGTESYLETFKQRLAELGYVEGKNLAIESRWAGGDFDRLPALASELVALKVDVIVPSGVAIVAAKQATATIPLVMMTSQDPVATGIVSSLAHPGGNITGMTRIASELAAKRLALLKELLPRISHVAFLWHDAPGSSIKTVLQETRAAALRLGLPISLVEVKAPKDFGDAFATAKRHRADALVMTHDGLTFSHVNRLVKLAAEHRMPTIYETSEWTVAGGLVSYGTNYTALYRRLAEYVDKIFKGAKPGDLPVEQPTQFELVVNKKTAKALGIKIPPRRESRGL